MLVVLRSKTLLVCIPDRAREYALYRMPDSGKPATSVVQT